MQVQSYLMFDGRAEEALEFYSKAIDAKLEMMLRFKDSPEPMPPGYLPPGSENKVMHMGFRVGDTLLMGSDGNCAGKGTFQGISLTLSVKTEAEADRRFAALSDGGQVQMPLAKTFFAPKFGVVVDRFGVSWMVIVDQPAQ